MPGQLAWFFIKETKWLDLTSVKLLYVMRTTTLYGRYAVKLIFVFCLPIFIACHQHPENQRVEKKDSVPVPLVIIKPPSTFSDTLVIDKPAVVFYNPDSIQLGKMKMVFPPNVYETEVHQNYYLMFTARKVLNEFWPRLTILETIRNRYLLFIRTDKSRTCIDLNSKGDWSGIIMFDTFKEPELADIMNVGTSLGFYFKQ